MTLCAAAFLAVLLPAPVLAQGEGVPDSAAADTTAADTTAAEAVPAAPHTLPTLEGFRKIAILSRDMLPGTPGYETMVEVYRGPERAEILRFVTSGTSWAFIVRPAGGAEAYTLRDFDCSGGYTEELQAGTPLSVPDCATPASPAAAPADDD